MKIEGFTAVGRSDEDRYFTVQQEDISIFGVLDGHGGTETVDYLKHSMPKLIFDKFNGQDPADINRILVNIFFELDRDLYNKGLAKLSGSTATVAVIYKDYIYVANSGDSRTIIFNDSGDILLETLDHSPDTATERKRIENIGGKVVPIQGVNRVSGMLAVSRGFGDFYLKQSNRVEGYDPRGYISVFPDIYQMKLDSNVGNIYIFLASDGLWEVFSSRYVADFFLSHNISQNLKTILKKLVRRATASTTDDVTSVLIIRS